MICESKIEIHFLERNFEIFILFVKSYKDFFWKELLPIRSNSCLRGIVGEPWNPYREVTQPEVHQNPRILIKDSSVRWHERATEYGLIRRISQRNVSIRRRDISIILFLFIRLYRNSVDEISCKSNFKQRTLRNFIVRNFVEI